MGLDYNIIFTISALLVGAIIGGIIGFFAGVDYLSKTGGTK